MFLMPITNKKKVYLILLNSKIQETNFLIYDLDFSELNLSEEIELTNILFFF